jgi:hypothetical protein
MKIPFLRNWFHRRSGKSVSPEEWAKSIQRSADAEQAVESLETRLYRAEKFLREKLASGEHGEDKPK